MTPRQKNPSPGFAKNPAKQVTVATHPGIVTVTAGGMVIARSGAAKVLTESPYPPAFYIPFADIDFSALEKTGHSTHCPYKGNASYWSALPASARGVNAMWAYEAPFDEVAEIACHGAFYPDRVAITAG